jgi:hypothetical protein
MLKVEKNIPLCSCVKYRQVQRTSRKSEWIFFSFLVGNYIKKFRHIKKKFIKKCDIRKQASESSN